MDRENGQGWLRAVRAGRLCDAFVAAMREVLAVERIGVPSILSPHCDRQTPLLNAHAAKRRFACSDQREAIDGLGVVTATACGNALIQVTSRRVGRNGDVAALSPPDAKCASEGKVVDLWHLHVREQQVACRLGAERITKSGPASTRRIPRRKMSPEMWTGSFEHSWRSSPPLGGSVIVGDETSIATPYMERAADGGACMTVVRAW